MYAPFIQRLELNTDIDAGGPSWELLLARVPTRPLLPNLQALAIGPSSSDQTSSRVIACVDAFLCPSLSDIRTAWRYELWMNPIEAGGLLSRMTSTCPNLRKLLILFGNSRYLDDLRWLVAYSTAGLFYPISHFRDLRVLHSSTVVLNPDILQLLGNLPHLESLIIDPVPNQSVGDDEIPITSLSLPKDSFPALRNLEVYRVPAIVIRKLWQTPPLVQKLVSVGVKPTLDSTEALNDMVRVVCQGSPQITDLKLDLSKTTDVEISMPVVDHFRQLPLRRLRIRGAPKAGACLARTSALPNLENLETSKMVNGFEELTSIAKHMPNLRYLYAKLNLQGWSSGMSLHPYSSSPSPICIDSPLTLGNYVGILDVDAIAQYVYFFVGTIVVFMLFSL